MVPLFTDIGSNLEEASQLCKQHDSVLEKLQGQQNPVEELLKQADETITRQKPRKEVSTMDCELHNRLGPVRVREYR